MRPNASDVAAGDAHGRDAPINRKAVIDDTLVANGFLFATHVDRCCYLGTSNREKPRWLEQNKGRFRRLDDVLQESAQLGRSNNVEVAPNCGTSSRDIRKGGGDDDNSSLARTLPEHRSLPHRPTSLPASAVNEDLNRSTQTEMQPRAKAAATGTKETKERGISAGGDGRNRDRSGSRQLREQKQPARNSKSAIKRTPERMRIVLDALRECPVQSCAAQKAGIHRKTLEYWIEGSKAGDDGYDVEWQGITERFHEHCESAIEEAHETLLDIEFQRAFGYDKILTWRGRVIYKIDEDLVGLGFEGPDAYLRDEDGNPVPETVRKQDPKAIRFLLTSLRPETYGKNPKIDTPQKGGVLVVGKDVTKKPEYNTAASLKARRWKAEARRIREDKD